MYGDNSELNDRLDRDDDVEKEREMVMRLDDKQKRNIPVIYADLWKIYPSSIGTFGLMIDCLTKFISSCTGKKLDAEGDKSKQPRRAVRGVSTALHTNEIYGLLGTNGAGKSSTMGVLTADVTPTSGEVYVCGYDVTGRDSQGLAEARKNIGYCPQVDPLIVLMTGRETLQMYARFRGIPIDKIDTEVNQLLERLTLTPHADKPCGTYSGGNKRKLSLGIALIGNPKVLLIDESSAGLDPVAKRKMWNLISEVSRNRSVILTTHSMQEAEALCSRAGIMASGELLCMGSVQHLKTKYLDGYTIDMFLHVDMVHQVADAVIAEVLSTSLPGSTVSERHGRFLRFDVPSASDIGLGTIFRRLESIRQDETMGVENYSVQQCTLEQVFIKLVNMNKEAQQQEELEVV